MKIYFDSDYDGNSMNYCPNGKDCMVGSIFCQQCEHCMYTRKWYNSDVCLFFVGKNATIRPAEYVECSCSGDITLWKIIKRYIYKLFN